MQEEDEKMEDRNWTYPSCTVGVPGRSRGRREPGFPSCPGGTWCFPPAPLAGQCAAASPWTPPGSPLAAGGKDTELQEVPGRRLRQGWPHLSTLPAQLTVQSLALPSCPLRSSSDAAILGFPSLDRNLFLRCTVYLEQSPIPSLIRKQTRVFQTIFGISLPQAVLPTVPARVHVCLCACLLTCLPACVYVCEICLRPFWFFAL